MACAGVPLPGYAKQAGVELSGRFEVSDLKGHTKNLGGRHAHRVLPVVRCWLPDVLSCDPVGVRWASVEVDLGPDGLQRCSGSTGSRYRSQPATTCSRRSRLRRELLPRRCRRTPTGPASPRTLRWGLVLGQLWWERGAGEPGGTRPAP